jgi:drug/metabolite transporter (DMT)-like permease
MMLMALFSLFDSSAGLFIKLIPWNPFVTAGLRGFLTFSVLLLFYRIQKIRFRISCTSLLGGIIISIMFISFITATRITTAANAALLQYTNPVFILLFAGIFFRQKPKAGDVAVVITVLLGIWLLFSGEYSGNQILGNGLALLSGTAFAGMFTFNNHVKDDEDHIGAILLGHFITFLVCIPFLFLKPLDIAPSGIWSLLAMVIFQQAVPFILYAKAIRICPPLTASLITMAGPVLNPVLVWLFIGEIPSPRAAGGGAVILLALGIWSGWGLLGKRPD